MSSAFWRLTAAFMVCGVWIQGLDSVLHSQTPGVKRYTSVGDEYSGHVRKPPSRPYIPSRPSTPSTPSASSSTDSEINGSGDCGTYKCPAICEGCADECGTYRCSPECSGCPPECGTDRCSSQCEECAPDSDCGSDICDPVCDNCEPECDTETCTASCDCNANCVPQFKEAHFQSIENGNCCGIPKQPRQNLVDGFRAYCEAVCRSPDLDPDSCQELNPAFPFLCFCNKPPKPFPPVKNCDEDEYDGKVKEAILSDTKLLEVLDDAEETTLKEVCACTKQACRAKLGWRALCTCELKPE